MNKRIKLATAVVALLMVAAIVVTFEACKKEEAITETTQKTPIAILDNNGNFKYNLTPDLIEKNLNKNMVELYSAKNDDRFVVDNVEILLPENNMPLTLAITIIDTEEETSNKVYLMNKYIEEIANGNVKEFYLSDIIEKEVFQTISFEKDGASLVSVDHGRITSSEKIENEDIPDMKPHHPYWHVICTGHNCKAGCDGTYYEQYSSYGCTDCIPQPGHVGNAECTKENTNWFGAIMHDIGLSIF